jgi:hypothetical protein
MTDHQGNALQRRLWPKPRIDRRQMLLLQVALLQRNTMLPPQQGICPVGRVQDRSNGLRDGSPDDHLWVLPSTQHIIDALPLLFPPALEHDLNAGCL